ncbi:MAG TPA: type II 3-dehydroquinate dehydratase [Caulobacteraceae bacterium]|jgi:3-dehydroquinate dehydratase-2|nr:type II 3-dehydroquinate dehydratase [Caulobacteraceae bacterium]
MATQKPIYVLNGPNLNLLGSREPHIYGTETLEDVRALCEAKAADGGFAIVFRQSNHEGVLIDWLHEARTDGAAVVINPGGYSHTSVSLMDAIKALEIPVIECHLSNPAKREPFRHTSFVSQAAQGVICGFGPLGYELAVAAAVRLAKAKVAPASAKV